MHVPYWMMRYSNRTLNIIFKIIKIIITLVKVWILGGFNENYDWEAGEEGFLSSTEVLVWNWDKTFLIITQAQGRTF